MGILGGMRDRDAEKYEIYINEEADELELIGIGYSAWGQVEEEKERTKYILSESSYQVEDNKIRIEDPKHIREFEIIKTIDKK